MAKELLSTDMMTDESEGIVDWKYLSLGIPQVEIVAEKDLMNSAQLEKFMQDELVIVVHKSTDKNAVPKAPVGVNGKIVWLPRDTKIRIPRYFVERLARSQEATFSTDDNPDPRADEGKTIHRTNGQVYPFQVLHDPAGARGQAWLSKVTRQGA